jgi:hypothetical protein
MHEHKVDTLPNRLRALAEELESAERYGVPMPYMGSVAEGASFHLDPDAFDAWAEYTEADVRSYEHDGRRWRSVSVDVNGLHFDFGTVVKS